MMANIGKSPCDEALMMGAAATIQSSSGSRGQWVLAATILGSSMAFIDGTVVNVALPALQSGLGATVAQVQWVVESYALLLAALLLPGGALGDLYGRRKIFSAGVVLFGLTSAWCGLAPNVLVLIAARGVQGIGAALLIPGSLSLISASFPVEERGRAIGTWSGFTAITAAIGPVLGGWLVQNLSWRWVFFINVPIAAVVLTLTLMRVAESRTRTQEQDQGSLDWGGAALSALGLGGIVYALIEPRHALLSGLIGIIASAGFVYMEQRAPAPMLPFSLFRSRDFAGANLITLFLYAAFSGVLFFFPMDLIQIHGYSATEAGAALLPLVLLIFVLSRWSGGLVERHGPKLPLIWGPVIAALGFGLFSVPGVDGRYWTTFFPAVVVLGLGMSVSVAPLTTTVMNAVSQKHVGTASGINNAISRVAGSLAIAVLGFVLIGIFNVNLDRRLNRSSIPSGVREQILTERSKLAGIQTENHLAREAIAESFIAGYRALLWIAVALSISASVSAAVLVGGRSKPNFEA